MINWPRGGEVAVEIFVEAVAERSGEVLLPEQYIESNIEILNVLPHDVRSGDGGGRRAARWGFAPVARGVRASSTCTSRSCILGRSLIVLNSARITILDPVLVLLVGSQGESPWKLHSAYAAGILHFFGMSVSLNLVTDEIGHLVETLAARLALVRPFVRVGEHVISQISCDNRREI